MNWVTKSEEIQARYFLSRPKAYLWIDFKPLDDLLVWSFTFEDLGMYHTLSSHAYVSVTVQGGYYVNSQLQESEEKALDKVFGGHYCRFIKDLYKSLNIEMSE